MRRREAEQRHPHGWKGAEDTHTHQLMNPRGWQRRSGIQGGCGPRILATDAKDRNVDSRARQAACVHAKLLQSYLTLCDPMDQSLESYMGFFRQEYWSGLPCPPLGESSLPRD